ncbi:hypothetical protein ACLMJK_001076 [Lecanora helva]
MLGYYSRLASSAVLPLPPPINFTIPATEAVKYVSQIPGEMVLRTVFSVSAGPYTPGFPPGFDVDYSWTKSMKLDPRQVFIEAVIVIFRLSLQNWDATVDLREIEETASDDGRVLLSITPAPMRSALLQPSHLILTIHQATFMMAARGEEGFIGFRGRLLLRKKLLGVVAMTSDRVPNELGNMIETTNATSSFSNRSTVMDNKGAKSGEFFDRAYKTAWEYIGLDLTAEEVFTMLIDTLTSIAPHELMETLENGWIVGHSHTGDTVISINPKNGHNFTYGQVTLALVQLMAQVIAPSNRYGEMSLTFFFAGEEVGNGVLFRARRLGNEDSSQNITLS